MYPSLSERAAHARRAHESESRASRVRGAAVGVVPGAAREKASLARYLSYADRLGVPCPTSSGEPCARVGGVTAARSAEQPRFGHRQPSFALPVPDTKGHVPAERRARRTSTTATRATHSRLKQSRQRGYCFASNRAVRRRLLRGRERKSTDKGPGVSENMAGISAKEIHRRWGVRYRLVRVDGACRGHTASSGPINCGNIHQTQEGAMSTPEGWQVLRESVTSKVQSSFPES
jgi:hypothetical protein